MDFTFILAVVSIACWLYKKGGTRVDFGLTDIDI